MKSLYFLGSLRRLGLLGSLLLGAGLAQAQPGSGGLTPPPTATEVPLDGGASVAVGGGRGAGPAAAAPPGSRR